MKVGGPRSGRCEEEGSVAPAKSHVSVPQLCRPAPGRYANSCKCKCSLYVGMKSEEISRNKKT
jgi:hypothetical protein